MSNILDEILANQLTIISLLQANPVSVAVATAVQSPVVVTDPNVVVNPIIADTVVTSPIVTSVASPVIAQAQSSTSIQLDKTGIPWDTRINTVKPDFTVKGVWKAKKGGGKPDAATIAAVTAELTATVAANPTAYQHWIKDVSTPVASAAVISPIVASPTVASPTVASPTVASPTVASPIVAPIVVADPNAAAKGEAITHVNVLVETWKVEYDNVLEVVEQYGGAKSFDELAPEYYIPAALAFKTWTDWLTACQTENTNIALLGGQQGTDGILAFCSQYGVKTIADVHHAELPELHAKLADYNAQWVAAVAASQGA